VSVSAERRWIENWRAAGAELEQRRRQELRALTDERALSLSEAVLALVRPEDLPVARRTNSGLAALQELFARARLR
jgi:hypothetical protein